VRTRFRPFHALIAATALVALGCAPCGLPLLPDDAEVRATFTDAFAAFDPRVCVQKVEVQEQITLPLAQIDASGERRVALEGACLRGEVRVVGTTSLWALLFEGSTVQWWAISPWW
jgi:hypothetical protein